MFALLEDTDASMVVLLEYSTVVRHMNVPLSSAIGSVKKANTFHCRLTTQFSKFLPISDASSEASFTNMV